MTYQIDVLARTVVPVNKKAVMSFDDYNKAVAQYAKSDRDLPIAIGRLLVRGDELFPDFYPDRYLQVLDNFPERKRKTVDNWRSICKSVEPEVCPDGVRIGQMDAVRGLSPAKQRHYLKLAVQNDYGRDDLLRLIAEDQGIPASVLEAAQHVKRAISALEKALAVEPSKDRRAKIMLAVKYLKEA
jgi:hypothetical protein